MSHDRTYNQRQLKLMLEAIESFRKGNSGIGKLVSVLDALVSCLRNTDESWKKAFASNWGKLEDIHAALQEKDGRNLKGSHSETVATAVAELTSLIQSEISE